MFRRPRPWLLAILVLGGVALGWPTPARADCGTVTTRIVSDMLDEPGRLPGDGARLSAYAAGSAVDMTRRNAESSGAADCVHEVYRRLSTELREQLQSAFASGYMERIPPDLMANVMVPAAPAEDGTSMLDGIIDRAASSILDAVHGGGVVDVPPDEGSADIVGRWLGVRIYDLYTGEEVSAYRGGNGRRSSLAARAASQR